MHKYVLVFGLTVFTMITANAAVEPLSKIAGHKCVLFPSGMVKCTGDNQYGQLGIGDTKDRKSSDPYSDLKVPFVDLGPTQVAIKVVTGSHHSCALFNSGHFKCWGRNHVGQLALPYGYNEDIGDEADEMAGLEYSGSPRARVANIYASGNKTCVRYTSGHKNCWGR